MSPLREILSTFLGHSGKRELQYLQQRTDTQKGLERYNFSCTLRNKFFLEDVQYVQVTEQQRFFLQCLLKMVYNDIVETQVN